jgi:hypothetical protein
MQSDLELYESARRWRIAGEKLRGIAPREFSRVLRLVADFAIDDDRALAEVISKLYPDP